MSRGYQTSHPNRKQIDISMEPARGPTYLQFKEPLFNNMPTYGNKVRFQKDLISLDRQELIYKVFFNMHLLEDSRK